MLTRRQIRVKVMQAVYAHYNGNNQSLKEGGASVKKSCLDMVNLYTTNLALFKALWDYSVAQHKRKESLAVGRRSANFMSSSQHLPLPCHSPCSGGGT